VTIKTTSGKSFTHRIDVPKGDPRDPMTLDELQIKFDALAEPIMSERRRQELRDTIFALETLDDVDQLTRLCVADR
jgi:2-methylcitrate dehydratase